MVIYLVGGAVRDFFLQEIFKHEEASQQHFFDNVEKDWVVVGATPEDMLAQAYRPVGKSFPVFLDPINQEEYALARIERKVGKGYTGFECFTSPDVSLEDDLKRRDLTINAMALPIDDSGQIIRNKNALIDPFGGHKDLEQKIFRHISTAFSEDPVRILRVARFAARWGDFTVHPDTNQLMKDMVASGEVNALTPERVWQEFLRALREKHPIRFFEVLKGCNALSILFPGLKDLTKLQKNLANILFLDNEVQRFAALVHHLTETQLQGLTNAYRVPNQFRELAVLVIRFYETYLHLDKNTDPESLLKFLENCDALRRSERFQDFLRVTTALTLQNSDVKNNFLVRILNQVRDIDTSDIVNKGLTGIQFAEELRNRRIQAIEKLLVDR